MAGSAQRTYSDSWTSLPSSESPSSVRTSSVVTLHFHLLRLGTHVGSSGGEATCSRGFASTEEEMRGGDLADRRWRLRVDARSGLPGLGLLPGSKQAAILGSPTSLASFRQRKAASTPGASTTSLATPSCPT
jgi:hypothetical protein